MRKIINCAVSEHQSKLQHSRLKPERSARSSAMNNDPGCSCIFPDVKMDLAENTNCRVNVNLRNELIGSDTPTLDADRRCACTFDRNLNFRVVSIVINVSITC